MTPLNFVNRKKSGVATEAKNAVGLVFVKCMRLIAVLVAGNERSILCVATTGLGDSLMITPALKGLKAALPDHNLTLLVTESSYQVFAANSSVDDFLFFRKGRGLLSLVKSLVVRGYSYSFVFHASDRLVWLLASGAAKTTIAGNWQPISIPKGIVDRWYETPFREHRIISHLKMSKLIASDIDLDATDMVFTHDVGVAENIHKWLLSEGCSESKMLVGFFPGAKDRFKCWSIENFLKLGRELEHLDFQVVLVGSEHDEDLTRVLGRGLARPLDFKGELQELAALLTNLDCLVTNDSGPMHLAIALNTSVVSLFGPTDDLETGPISSVSKQLTIRRPVTCYPSKEFPIIETQCFNKKCSNPMCINQITVGEVLEKVMLINNLVK